MASLIVTALAVIGSTFLAEGSRDCPHQPYGRFWKWSNLSDKPGDGDDYVVETSVLLDTTTARLRSLVIKAGGRLVFDPNAKLAKLISDGVIIESGGSMEIGGETCPFWGQAEILLTGSKYDRTEAHQDFGRKFLGVKAGGTLLIYGRDLKASFPLQTTVSPNPAIYNFESNQPGISIYEFERQSGKLRSLADGIINAKHLRIQLSAVKQDSLLILVAGGEIRTRKMFKKLRKTSRDIVNKIVDGAGSHLFKHWTERDSSWALIVDKTSRKFKLNIRHGGDCREQVLFTKHPSMTVGNVLYRAHDVLTSNNKCGDKPHVSSMLVTASEFTVPETDFYLTWRAGDRLVITSSDSDMNHAEEATITSVVGNKVQIDALFQHTHYGLQDSGLTSGRYPATGVVLNRNILIHGEMITACDKYGGHIKFLKGFGRVHIRYAEFTNMGQASSSDAFPVNIDLDENTPSPSIVGNSFHHNFNGCFSIKGKYSYLYIWNNVGYDTYGHCFHIEGGGIIGSSSFHTSIVDNVGMLTRSASWLQQPTTFDFDFDATRVIVNSNVAAGSSSDGFRLHLPDYPGSDFHVQGNVAHSNGVKGVNIDGRQKSGATPRKTPHHLLGFDVVNNRYGVYISTRAPLVMERFHVYGSIVGMHFLHDDNPVRLAMSSIMQKKDFEFQTAVHAKLGLPLKLDGVTMELNPHGSCGIQFEGNSNSNSADVASAMDISFMQYEHFGFLYRSKAKVLCRDPKLAVTGETAIVDIDGTLTGFVGPVKLSSAIFKQ